MLIAAIPTLKKGRIDSLLNQIQECYVRPDEVYILNNTGEPCDLSHYPANFFDIQFPKNIGVNAAWNFALTIATDKRSNLSILNDDIVLSDSDFFRRIIDSLKFNPKAGVICPNTDSGNGYESCTRENRVYIRMAKREGWAFTIRRELVHRLPLIPKELFVFFGDDWIWFFTCQKGYVWIKDLSNKISHKIGVTLRENPDLRMKLEYERKAYRKAVNEIMSLYRS